MNTKVTHSWSQNDIRKNREGINKIFLYRICGTGMGATVVLLREKGLHVEGADIKFYPPMSNYLQESGIPLSQLSQVTKEKLQEFDLIIVGNVVPKGSPDALQIESSGVPYCSFPAALGALVLGDVNVVGIAGTHGKTTTTYFCSQIFSKLGLCPGHFIGGVIDGVPPSQLGDGKYFFIESDEYDSAYFEKFSKFRSYSIDNLILTSLEFDHGDIFNSLEDIKYQFRCALSEIKKRKIVCSDYPASMELYHEFESKEEKPWLFYGDDSTIGPKILSQSPKGTEFSICWNGQDILFNTNLVGKHNIFNLTATLLYALSEGLEISALKDAILDMKMVRRRQEVRGRYKGSLVIDDFAHHPRAVEMTLDGIRIQYPEHKIVTILEPASATARSDLFQAEFVQALKNTDVAIIIKPERPTSLRAHKNLDCEKLAVDIAKLNVQAHLVVEYENLKKLIDNYASESTIFLILSNSTCLGLWESDFVRELRPIH